MPRAKMEAAKFFANTYGTDGFLTEEPPNVVGMSFVTYYNTRCILNSTGFKFLEEYIKRLTYIEQTRERLFLIV